MLPFSLLLLPLSWISYFYMLMRLNPTTNKGSLVLRQKISDLISVVGYGYEWQMLWEWPLLISGNFFVMGLRETTMKSWSASENSWNDVLYIYPTIIFHLIFGPRKIAYLPSVRSMKERQFILFVHFIFPVLFILPHRPEISPT